MDIVSIGHSILRCSFARLFTVTLDRLIVLLVPVGVARRLVALGRLLRHLHRVLHVLVIVRSGDRSLGLVQMAVLGLHKSVIVTAAKVTRRPTRARPTQVLRAVGPWGLFRGP